MPVYSLENAPAVSTNEVGGSSDEDSSPPEERIRINIDRKAGYITAEKTTRISARTYAFDIVDADTQKCKHRDDIDQLPTEVIHAVYDTGFSLVDYDPLGEWFHLWLETRLIRAQINSLEFAEADKLARIVHEETNLALAHLDELIGARFVAGNHDDYTELENNGKFAIAKKQFPDGTERPVGADNVLGQRSYGDSRGTVVRRSAPHLLLEQPATEHDNFEYFELIIGEDLYPPVSTQTHHHEEANQLSVDTITEHGIQRLTFDITGDATCVPAGETPVECISSYALDAVDQAGFTVEGATNVFDNTSEHTLIAACQKKLRDMWQFAHSTTSGRPDSMIDRHYHPVRSNLVTLFAAVSLHEIMPGRYEKHITTVSKRDTDRELYEKAIHYLMQVHAKSHKSDREDLETYLSELNYVQEDIVGTQMESLSQVARNIGIIWHAIENEMHPPKR